MKITTLFVLMVIICLSLGTLCFGGEPINNPATDRNSKYTDYEWLGHWDFRGQVPRCYIPNGTDPNELARVAYVDAKVSSTFGGTSSPAAAVMLTVAASDSSATDKKAANYICDGNSDQTEINAALAAAKSVQLSAGTYSLTDSVLIPSNTSLYGVGYSTKLKIAASVGNTTFKIISNSDTTNGNTNIKISNLLCDGSDTQSAIANPNTQKGIYLFKCTNSIIANNWIEHLGGLSPSSCIGINPSGCTDLVITENIITDTVDCINTSTTTNPCYRLTVTGNIINSTNRDYGLNIYACHQSVWSNNIVRECFKTGINIFDSNENLVTDNIVVNCGRQTDNTYPAISIYNSANITTRNQVSGNIVRKSPTGNNANYGIYVQSGTVGNKVFNNDVQGSGVTSDFLDSGTATLKYNNITSKSTVTAGYSISAYASGTPYTVTTGNGFVDFGTTDPAITINQAGTYLITGTVNLYYNACKVTGDTKIYTYLRRTNNTALDIADSNTSVGTAALSSATSRTAAIVAIPCIIYTTQNNDDILQLWSYSSASMTEGTITIPQASIIATKLY